MLTFEEDTHTYRVDGKVYPSVTQTMQKAGLIDLSMIPAATLEKARQEGKAVHRMVEAECKGESYVNLPGWLKPYQRAWHLFVEWSGFELWASEERLYNERYGFAGTPDLVGIPHKFKDPQPAAVDLKRSLVTGSAIGVQLSAYAETWNLKYGKDKTLIVRRRYGLQLIPSTGSSPYKCLPFESKTDFQDFLTCLQYARMMERYK
jgi:hypothetical protein